MDHGELRMKNGFRGILSLPVTPFTRDDEIDEAALRSLLDYIVENRPDGIVPTGSTGEFTLLSHEERKKVVEVTVDQVNGRTPVIAGTGAQSTWEAVALTKHAKDVGADGAMVVTPYFNRINDEELYDYYKTIAEKVDIPIIVYNNPGCTGVNVKPDLLRRLAEDLDNIATYKEDNFDLFQFGSIIHRCAGMITLLTGSAFGLLAFLAMGGHGALCAEYQLAPKLIREMYDTFQKGEVKRAVELHSKVAKLMHATFPMGTFPAGIKAMLNLQGHRVGSPRRPILPSSKESVDSARKVLEELDLLQIR
jgi:4-hydroxy-tetrahydrodipicolinate synthase